MILEGRLRKSLLYGIWTVAAVGIICKWTLSEPPHWITVTLYVAMGWTGIVPVYQLVKAIGLQGMGWSLLGGLLYTVGTVCEATRWPVLWPHVVGYHEVFHILDMSATSVHISLSSGTFCRSRDCDLGLLGQP